MPKTDYIPEQKQFKVELYHDQLGRLGSGVLYFGGNQWACVALEILDKSPELSRNDAKFDLVKAITDQGTTFCLYDCKVNGSNIYADYAINGDLNEATFDTISVRYNEVSEWFLRWRVIDGSVGETLSWQQMPNDINVSVKTDKEQFDLRSKYYGFHIQRGEDLVLNEHVVFIFSAKANRFSLADVKAKSHELSCLLSILLAYPVTIANVVVSQGISYPRRVHFPTFERPERAKDNNAFWASCFIQQPDLDGRWQSIFDHYYRSSYRKVCWVRLAGMQRYEGFWEYKVLGYFSLLDRYLSIGFNGVKSSEPQPPSGRKMKKFRQNLMSELPVISAEEQEKVVEIARKAFGSDDFSFERKYKIATLNADDDIMKIINLSDDDFTLTKKVRNKIAHGDDPGLKQEQFPVVMRAVSKIALLLTYWSFLDFGFTTHEFITYLEKTHSKLARHAIINKAYMARVTGSAEFLPVTKEILQLFQEKKVSGVYGCWVEDKAGKLTFSKYFTKKYRDWMHDSTKTSNRHDPEKIFGICKDKARLIGRGYFECGDEYQEFHHSWIIRQTDPAPNMPPVPS